MRPVSSWGLLSRDLHEVVEFHDPATISRQIAPAERAGLAHGAGRSYGDVCLNPDGTLWRTTGLDHLISFDPETGLLVCEAGVLLRDIQRLFIPRGWMLPVSPGTQDVTVGGAIANDVHGKNHHVAGSFGHHVAHLKLVRTDGEVIECGPDERADWFAATVGGLGLTGVVVEAGLRLRPVAGPWLNAETLPFPTLDAFLALSAASERDWEYTVAWIDCLDGDRTRGLFMRANPADRSTPVPKAKRRRAMPVVPPVSLVNRWSLRPFNAAYYHLKKRGAGPRLQDYETVLYPLDHIAHWNRIYGRKGFFQYQCLVPPYGIDAVRALLKTIADHRDGSFLTVLKAFGDRPPAGLLSFPGPGLSLALDFPNRSVRTARLFARLDAIVREADGRLYPAKDARMPRDLFEAGYPNLSAFSSFRDPRISSSLSRRLMGS